MYKFKKGFTLVELIIAIFIIAVIATFVIVRMQESKEISDNAKREADMEIIKNGIIAYRANNYNNVPILDCAIGEGTCADDLLVYLSPYINFIPAPDDKTFYTYSSSDGIECVVSAVSSEDPFIEPYYQFRCSDF